MKPLSKNPALDAYSASLVNLRLFDLPEELPDQDAETEVEFDDLTLSPLGFALAQAYDSLVGPLAVTKKLSSRCLHAPAPSYGNW